MTAILARDCKEYTIAELAEETGIPNTEIGRYIHEEVFEPRTYQWLVEMKTHKPSAYKHYLHNHKVICKHDKQLTCAMARQGETPTEPAHRLYVNFSKYSILLNNAKLMKFAVIPFVNTSGTQILAVYKAEDSPYHTPEADKFYRPG